MKRIIEGKVYDTDKAEEIATYSSHHYPNDFHYYEETLYKTAKGNFFLAGEGGAASKYSQPVHGGRGGGSALEPLTADEAREWLELHKFTDELEEHFPDHLEEA